MSHFAVLVIDDNVEQQLAPFQENNMGDCPSEFMEFHETETEMLEEYETESIEQIIMPDGTMFYTFDDQFKVKNSDPFADTKYKYPKGSVRGEIPYRVKFATFEEFVKDFHNQEERDPEEGAYGYWENPNAKWDWWVIGGRWSGFFQLKPDVAGTLGERGSYEKVLNTPDNRAGKADQAFKRDIDFDLMRHEARYEAVKRFDNFDEFMVKFPNFKGWTHFRELMEIDAAREAYRSQDGKNELEETFGFSMDCWADRFSIGREKYIAQQEASAFATFAVVKDGKWYERGSMGWWGCVADEKDSDNWNEEFLKLIEGVSDDTLLTIIDCHI